MLRQDFAVGERSVARLDVQLACVRGTDGRPSRIPSRWRAAFEEVQWRDTTTAAVRGPGGDLSILTLFLQADIVVKIVMMLLLLASVWVWAIIFEKVTSLRRANRQADAFEDRFWSGGSLDELYDRRAPSPAIPWPPCSAPRWANGGAAPGWPAPTWRAAACGTGWTAP